MYQYVNPQSTEYPYAICTDSSENTYTTGCIFVANRRGLGVIKLNNAGIIQWLFFNDTLRFGATGYDVVFRFNRVYLAGEIGNDVLVTACLSAFGNNLWLYCDIFASCGYAIGISESCHIYVAGIKYPSPSDRVVLKLDSLGDLCWRYVYDGPAGSYDEASGIVVDQNENIYVGGYSTGLGTSNDFTIIKLDSAGNEKWVYCYDGYAHYYDWAEEVVVDDSGFVYACGLSYLYNNTLQYFAVIAIDSGGVEFWRYLTAGPLGYGGYPRRMVLDGYLAVVKLRGLGNEEWVYKDPYAMIARGIVADVVGNETIKTNFGAIIFKGGIEFIPQADCRLEVYEAIGRMVVKWVLYQGAKNTY